MPMKNNFFYKRPLSGKIFCKFYFTLLFSIKYANTYAKFMSLIHISSSWSVLRTQIWVLAPLLIPLWVIASRTASSHPVEKFIFIIKFRIKFHWIYANSNVNFITPAEMTKKSYLNIYGHFESVAVIFQSAINYYSL